ncbi:hypothetical protein ACN47E_008306 [Coniothyrium glycines]
MGVYRVEASPNNRAGCKVGACKDNAVKIMKGELRFAVQITIQEHQSWQYRHWGCVTPQQISNLIETTDGDTDMVDGYDELPAEFQEKIKYALENGHVADEDWKHDPELNRPGQKGFIKKVPKKKAKKNADQDADSGEEPEEKPKKKRAPKAKKTDDDAEETAPKKKRGRPAKKQADDVEEDEDDAPAPKKARGRAKKVEYKEESDEDEAPPPKKARGRKAAPKEEVEPTEEDDPAEEEEAPKHKRGKKVTAAANGEAKVPQKRGRKKKVATVEE